MKKLEQIDTQEQHELLQQQLVSEIKEVIQDLDIHHILREQSDSQSGLQLFLSGGGFRGWGYVLMSKVDNKFRNPSFVIADQTISF